MLTKSTLANVRFAVANPSRYRVMFGGSVNELIPYALDRLRTGIAINADA